MVNDVAAGNVGAPDPKGTSNPIAHATNITLSVPEAVEVQLVDAGALGDYEAWLFLASAGISTTSGFLVAMFQAPDDEKMKYIWFVVFLAVVSATFLWRAYRTRRKLKGSVRKLRFAVGEPILDEELA